ncbi:putative glycosyltransferase EpsJ [Lachnospiraceae bacterium]|nr:putative glycosyltransferase EpsJ [Lachnospiraceae bacterium]
MNENSEVCHEKKLGGGKKDADKLPKVAIIIPIYNVEHTLVENCISSVIVQTYKEIEIVLVDDGNDKDYAEFIEKFKRIDNRISVYRHEQNQGLYQARMSGVNKLPRCKHSNTPVVFECLHRGSLLGIRELIRACECRLSALFVFMIPVIFDRIL